MRIFNLSKKTGNLSSNDFFGVDNGSTVNKIDYNALAKAIIEQYTGSSLAGSAQSVKAALDALNSKTSFLVRSVSFEYSIASGGNTNTNLKDLIDADLPTGKSFLGIVGVATNDIYVNVCNVYYGNSYYSLQMRNTANSTRSQTARIFYLCS